MPVGTLKAVASGVNGPCDWVNVFYFGVTGTTPTQSEVSADIFNVMHEFYGTLFGGGSFNDSWEFQYTKVYWRDAEDSIVRFTVADAVGGTGADEFGYGQTSYLLNWANQDPRKGGKPRSYVSGVVEASMQDSARLKSTFQSAVAGRVPAFFTTIADTDSGLVLIDLSFRNGNAWRDVAYAYPITGASLSPVIATQRRRVDRLR